MANSGQLRGVVSYLTKLIHTVDMYEFKFVNVSIDESSKTVINYDFDITSK